MKVRNIKIAIRSQKRLYDEIEETWGRIEKGEKVGKREGIYFENLEAMRRVLTEERLRILKAVKQHHPSSIYELAKMLGRDVKNTFDDVQFLVQAGLIELKKTKGGREKTTPIVNYDNIVLEIPI